MLSEFVENWFKSYISGIRPGYLIDGNRVYSIDKLSSDIPDSKELREVIVNLILRTLSVGILDIEVGCCIPIDIVLWEKNIIPRFDSWIGSASYKGSFKIEKLVPGLAEFKLLTHFCSSDLAGSLAHIRHIGRLDELSGHLNRLSLLNSCSKTLDKEILRLVFTGRFHWTFEFRSIFLTLNSSYSSRFVHPFESNFCILLLEKHYTIDSSFIKSIF